MFRHATETYYIKKIERLEKQLEEARAELEELRKEDKPLPEYSDDELF